MITFTNKRILVVGAGASGIAVSRLLTSLGATVCLVDESEPKLDAVILGDLEGLGVRCCFGMDSVRDLACDLAVVSPGISKESPLMRELLLRQVPVLSEIEAAFQCFKGRIVSITGTNGKTTTTRMIEAILSGSDVASSSAGNIGYPFSALVQEQPQTEWVSLELSSFQLENISEFRSEIAVLLNLAPDHLNRHESLEDYYRAKARIFENQRPDDVSIIQLEAKEIMDSLGCRFAGRVLTFSTQDVSADLYLARGFVVSRIPGWSGIVYDISTGAIRGKHNVENVMASLLCGHAIGLSLSDIQVALSAFRTGAHRFELLPSLDGIGLVNDSKSTNPASLCAALDAARELLSKDGRLWLLAGGEGKQLSFDSLSSLVAKHVHGLFLFGRSRHELQSHLGASSWCFVSENLRESIQAVFEHARSGDIVLFSPGCASFDQFRDYVERGEYFKELIRQRRQDLVLSGLKNRQGTAVSHRSNANGIGDQAEVGSFALENK